MKKEIKPDQFFIGMPSLTALKAFVASAIYRSFTDASKALCVTQSAVSRQVRELESDLNVSLFNRVGHAIELTEEGKKLYEAAYICFSYISQTTSEIQESRDSINNIERRNLKIAMTHAFSVLWMAPKMSDFRSQFPDIELAVLATDDFKSMEDDDSVDGYFTIHINENIDHVSVPIFSEEVYPVCSPAYLDDHPEIRDSNNLLYADLLHLKGAQAHHGFSWKHWFEFSNIDTDKVFDDNLKMVSASNYQFLIKMTLDNQGVALGWDHLVKNLIGRNKLIRPVDESVKLKNYNHYFVHKKYTDVDEKIAKFKRWLIEQF